MARTVDLTRKGRLAEALAIIRRKLGGTSAPSAGRDQVPEPPVIGGEKPGAKPPVLFPTGGEGVLNGRPGFAAPDLTELLRKLPGRQPGSRQFTPEVIGPANGQWSVRTYSGEGGTRVYKVFKPGSWQKQPPLMVVMLHGCTQSADDFAAGTRMNFLAEEEGLLVVYPEQSAAANSSRCWNWFQPAHQQRSLGEPAIIAGITRQVMAEHQVDPNHVYIAGLSAGGAMAAILATTYPELYAAVGVHSGLAPNSAHDLPSALKAMQGKGQAVGAQPGARADAIPLLVFHGDGDATVHPGNAEELIRQWGGPSDRPPVMRYGQAGGRSYSCAAYQDASGQIFVEHWTIHGADHGWSGGSPNGSFTEPAGLDASRELARFCREHPRKSSVVF